MAEYAKISYWNNRYCTDVKPFEWYQKYEFLKSVFKSEKLSSDDEILVVGCGTSKLSEDMYEDGYKNICNIDASHVCIKLMNDRTMDNNNIVFKQMDCTKMDEFENEYYNAIIDKACMDSLLCGENAENSINMYFSHVARILKQNGKFFVLSYGLPSSRLEYFQNSNYSWTVSTKAIPKPYFGLEETQTLPAVDDARKFHYMYICTKI